MTDSLTQARQRLCDAAMAYSVARARWLAAHGVANVTATSRFREATSALVLAAEDYAEAVLRAPKEGK